MQAERKGIHFRIIFHPYKKEIDSESSLVFVDQHYPFEALNKYIKDKARDLMNLDKHFYHIRTPKDLNLVIDKNNYSKFRDYFLQKGETIDLLVRERNPQEIQEKYGIYLEEQGCIFGENKEISFAQDQKFLKEPNENTTEQSLQYTLSKNIQTEPYHESFFFASSDSNRSSFFQQNSFDYVGLLKQLDLVYKSQFPYR